MLRITQQAIRLSLRRLHIVTCGAWTTSLSHGHSDAAHAARSVVDGARVCEYALYKKGQRFYLKVVNPDDGPD